VDLAAVDEWWTTWLGTTPDQLRTGGVAVADHVDHVGVVEVAHGQAPLVYGPSRWVNPLRDAVLPATSAWSTNAASIAVAERVGFVFYARAVVVDIAA
jgi:hypothetical protein